MKEMYMEIDQFFKRIVLSFNNLFLNKNIWDIFVRQRFLRWNIISGLVIFYRLYQYSVLYKVDVQYFFIKIYFGLNLYSRK